MNNYNKATFKNGLKVITAEVPNSEVVTISISIRSGSRFEKVGEHG